MGFVMCNSSLNIPSTAVSQLKLILLCMLYANASGSLKRKKNCALSKKKPKIKIKLKRNINMSIRFKCIMIDHDDTSVDSTRTIHYPSHLDFMREWKPEVPDITLDEWFRKNNDPGIGKWYQELGIVGDVRTKEVDHWYKFICAHTPPFYPGFLDVLREYTRRGGIVVVSSHSLEDQIRRHYSELADGFMPNYIYGWDEEDHSRMKPSPWPIHDTMKRFNLIPADIMVLDDLRPGIAMAKGVPGVTSAAAGWGSSHIIPEIRDEMKELCDLYFPTVEDFKKALLVD